MEDIVYMKNKIHKPKILHCHIIGKSQNNLILLHGWGFNSKIWFYVIKILKKNLQFI